MMDYIKYPGKEQWKQLVQRPFHDDKETTDESRD